MPSVGVAPISAVTTPNVVKLGYVNALRGLAILMVIACHAAVMAPHGLDHLPAAFSAVVGSGARGVQLFFVASGFTMFYSLSRRKPLEPRATLTFFLRRFFRIAPLYWLGLVGYSCWFYYMDGRTFTLANTLAEVFFLHGISPYWINALQPGGWSVTAEMCFYLLVPLLYRRVTTLNRALKFVLATTLLNTVLQVTLQHAAIGHINTPYGWFQWNAFLFCFLPSQLPVFGMGFVLYFLATQPHDRAVDPGVLLAGAVLLLGAWAAGSGSGTALQPGTQGLREYLLPAHHVFGMGFVALALALSKRPYHLLVNPLTQFVGQISFSLYLGHFLVIFLLTHYGWADIMAPTSPVRAILNFVWRFVCTCAGGIPLAYCLHRVVENPGQRLGQRVIEKLEKW